MTVGGTIWPWPVPADWLSMTLVIVVAWKDPQPTLMTATIILATAGMILT